ncbi:hypothetical protein MHH37_09900 [Solibacillus sp. FSL K6-1781]|uniref:hypothetical protein n=1 Tax=Solibacillus sp. FSL K6-1781 TaxID=2921474 RepID=UPI00315B2A13
MKRKYLEKFDIDPIFFNPLNWSELYIMDLPSEQQHDIIRKKEAIDLFLQSDLNVKSIALQTGVPQSEIYRLVKRCLTLKNDNEVYGYAGLLINFRVKNYVRSNCGDNHSGNFNKLLEDYPELQELLYEEHFSTSKSKVREKKQSTKYIHKRFVYKCKDLGIKDGEYPLNTVSKGFKSVERYLKSLTNIYSHLSTKSSGKDAANLAKNTNNSTNAHTEIIRPFERVEFDAHTIDAIFSIITYTPQGDKIITVMNRLWLLAVVDVASRAVIGYHISYTNNNYSSDDVIKCFKNSLLLWKPKDLEIPTLKYNEGDGFPSYIIKKSQYGIWDEICFDNAKAHLSTKVINHLTDLKCSINFGPVATPTRRSIVERFFLTLEHNGFHRLPSTTGSNILDPKRDRAEEKSIIYEITVDDLEEIMDLVIANYNNTAHSAHYGFTPLEIIKSRLERGMYIRKLPKHKRTPANLFPTEEKVKVHGNIQKGINPYIFYKYVRYSSEQLNNDKSIIGERLTLIIDEDNIQTIRTYKNDGTFYDTLTAKGMWGKIPNSLKIRQMIMQHKYKEEFADIDHVDPLIAYLDHLSTLSLTDKKAKIKLREITRYIKEHNINTQIEKQRVINDENQKKQKELHDNVIKRIENQKNKQEIENTIVALAAEESYLEESKEETSKYYQSNERLENIIKTSRFTVGSKRHTKSKEE